MFGRLHRLIDAMADLPGIRHARMASYDRHFAQNTNRNLFRGVFASAQAAERSAPRTRALGYDNAESVTPYEGRLAVFPNDYPVMFWLTEAFAQGMRTVTDFGGHVGIKYYAFATHIAYPADLRWLVVDVPAVVRRGGELAIERGAAMQLRFSERFEDADGGDLLFASGSLQYVPERLPDLLGRLARPPRRIIVNTTPLHPTKTFYTLNSIGSAFCAYRIERESEFVDALAAVGYRPRDRWPNLERRVTIPFTDAEHAVTQYVGYCFDRAAT